MKINNDHNRKFITCSLEIMHTILAHMSLTGGSLMPMPNFKGMGNWSLFACPEEAETQRCWWVLVMSMKSPLGHRALCFFEGEFIEEKSYLCLVTWYNGNLFGHLCIVSSIFLHHVWHLQVLHINKVWNEFFYLYTPKEIWCQKPKVDTLREK